MSNEPEPGKELRISAKALGMAREGFCPRCFWLRLHAQRMPYQVFPAVFSLIDSYVKRETSAAFSRGGRAPALLGELGLKVAGCEKAPQAARFRVRDEASGVTLTGTPDAVFRLRDGSRVIADYKTSRSFDRPGGLSRVYEVQLNAYAYIAQHGRHLPGVSALWLVYIYPDYPGAGEQPVEEPCAQPRQPDEPAAQTNLPLPPPEFRMRFSSRVVPVALQPEIITPLLEKAKELWQMPAPPPGNPGCIDCQALGALMSLLHDGERLA